MPIDQLQPVQVGFSSLYQPDLVGLSTSLIPFGRWADEHIAVDLPVSVTFPVEIRRRLDVLRGYLAPEGWPPGVAYAARHAVEQLLGEIEEDVTSEITHAVRVVAAAAIRDDGSRATGIRNQLLESFLAAKMLAVARVLNTLRLEGEPSLGWGHEFREMKAIYSPRLIYGLAYLAREPEGWAGWTDADFHMGGRRFRLYVPICPNVPICPTPGRGHAHETFTPEDVRQLIVPQLLRVDRAEPVSMDEIRSLLFGDWTNWRRELVMRNEQFLDSVTCTDHPNARSYIVKAAADRIKPILGGLSPDRWLEGLKLAPSLYPLSRDVLQLARADLPDEKPRS